MKSIGFAAILMSVCAAAACVDDTNTDGSGGGGGSTSSTSSSSSSSSSVSVTSSSSVSVTSSVSTGPQTCADLPSEECGQCCAQEHATGVEVLNDSYLTNCACADGAACTAACNTADAATDLCLDDGTFNLQVMNDACLACLDGLTGDEACWMPIGNDCRAEPDCIAYIQCAQGCP